LIKAREAGRPSGPSFTVKKMATKTRRRKERIFLINPWCTVVSWCLGGEEIFIVSGEKKFTTYIDLQKLLVISKI